MEKIFSNTTSDHDVFEKHYQALKSRDRRFDGRLFVGVSSTGIYCRPICPARLPKPENCQFYTTAVAAEQSGFRPCKRCRPELAPGLACIDMSGTLLDEACRLINRGFLDKHTVSELADRLGITSRHLRRLFQEGTGISPLDLAISRRLMQALQLITDTSLSMTNIALLSGFNSIRSFNHVFMQHYRKAPSTLRTRKFLAANQPIRLQLGYRPPYDWETLLNFLSQRTIPGVEYITGTHYRRTVSLSRNQGQKIRGWIEVSERKEKCQLEVTLSPELTPAISEILLRIRRLFDLDADPQDINERLGHLVSNPGLRLPGAFDGFEMSIRAILGQQITVKAAHTLATRVAQTFGTPLDTPFPELNVTFPTAQEIRALTPDQLGERGIIRQRCRAILSMADAVANGEIDLSPLANVPVTLKALEALPGIGPWTAHYIAMRALSWPDAFPDSDLGIIKALGTKHRKSILETAEQWSPWRAYAVMHLWHRPVHAPLPVNSKYADKETA